MTSGFAKPGQRLKKNGDGRNWLKKSSVPFASPNHKLLSVAGRGNLPMDMDITVPWARQRLKQWSWLVTRPSSPNYAPLDLQPGNPLKYTYPLAVIGNRAAKAGSAKCSPVLSKKV